MKPTNEQIEAALRWSDYRPHLPSGSTAKDVALLIDHQNDNSLATCTQASMDILAAAYREQQRELAEVRQQRDTLAEALREYMACHKRHGYATKEKIDKANAALATLKGEA